ncbi:hypothetical protein CPB83DRAFT_907169 [Crepidotus variabilis]|uniref:Mitochondrial distribution and morphology protein 34 n=1 Tax=Crepidotus variabilis TaxID=179855 RepID=A0A9P6EEG6_9AGAR|nr:hypothetical protein CPB83DRAFT_907169 [Crepidotus variabilis]
MSFTFNWPRFSDQFHYDAIEMLNTALNKGNKPPIIADKIEVVELEMGSQPPELEIRDIGDLTVDQFRGIFRLTYNGDAHLVLKTKVQANPLNHKQPDIHIMAGSRGMLAAKQPLVVPMLLRLSHFRLSSYVVLVVSKQKGITLVFKTDPLQNVDINSTFDSIAVIQNFIQREIEDQLRQMFREDLPGIIHRLSQQWVKAKVEAPYLSTQPPPATVPSRPLDTMSNPDVVAHRTVDIGGVRHNLIRKASMTSVGSRRARSTTCVSSHKTPDSAPFPQSSALDTSASSHPDLEHFDPTYGLRPEGLPLKSVFKGFGSLFAPNKGLADLAEEIEESEDGDEEEGDEGASFDVVDWVDTVPGFSPPLSDRVEKDRETTTEYETVPAVGGGTITRPRIYHSQSAIHPHSAIHPLSKSLSSLPKRTHSQTGIIHSGMATPSIMSRPPSFPSSSYFPDYQSSVAGPSQYNGFASRVPQPPSAGRARSPDSLESQHSRSSSGPTRTLSTEPTDPAAFDDHPNAATQSAIYMRRPPSERRFSVTSTSTHMSNGEHAENYPSNPSESPGLPKIILRPTLNNNSIHQLSTLSHSNHTLSPYTRDLSHFTVRSVPPRSAGGGPHTPGGLTVGGERPPVRAKRKRTYRLGHSKPAPTSLSHTTPSYPSSSSPTPPSEFDESDMDTYFPATNRPLANPTEIYSDLSRPGFGSRPSRPTVSTSLSTSREPVAREGSTISDYTASSRRPKSNMQSITYGPS